MSIAVPTSPGYPAGEPAVPAPPVAAKQPKVTVVHGERCLDDYFWLREKSDPEVAAYLEAENAYAEALLKPLEGFRETLYREMLSHIKETDLSVPYRKGEYFYYSRTEEGKQYPIRCRKRGSLDAAEETILDLNELAKGHPFLGLGLFEVSEDGNFLAYSTDFTGFREYTLNVKDLRTGEILPERVEKVSAAAWANDSRTLIYVTDDPAKRPYRLYRHRLGSSDHILIYEETDERFRLDVGRSRSKGFLFLTIASHTTSEVRYLPAGRPEDEWKLVAPREQDHEYYVDHHDQLFYIRSNKDARNFRLLAASIGDPRAESWREIVPHRPDVMLEGLELFRDHRVLLERQDGLPRFHVTDLRTGESHDVAFPEPAYTAFPENNPEFDTTAFRYGYQSLVTPNSVFDYDLERRESKLLKQTEVPGYDAKLYRSERLYARAEDGARIPISLVYRGELECDGRRPMLLTGYGAYGFPYPVSFSSNRLALLDRGVVFAMAHVRGGGEMGKAWHDQGRMKNKFNTFTDFIAAAELLMNEKVTSRDRVAIEGGSAGGLLIGGVLNLRPDLFKAAVLKVPFVDVINTMLDASLPLTVPEYEEWGNPNQKEHYDYLKTYCPYTNLEAKDYPSILVRTSLNDSQVMYWEPAKYVAKLRTLKTDTNPLLLVTNMAAGHGGASGRYDYLHELAHDYAFILWLLGLADGAKPQ